MFFAVSDLFNTRPSRKRPAVESKPQFREPVTEPRRGESRQEPSFVFPLRNDNPDRIRVRNHGRCPFEQVTTEDHLALLISIKKNKKSVRLTKQRDLDVMLDSKFVLPVMSNRQGSLPRGANWSDYVDLDVIVVAK